MNGALPPSSSDSFFTVVAHCAISSLPISVEPVNDSLRTIGLLVSSPPISDADPVMTLNTPFGTPARSASSASASAENGVCDAGLSTTVQPAAIAGPALRVIIASGKFHGVMQATTPIGSLMTTMRLSAWWRGDRVAVDALGFFAEPFEERRRVGDLAARLGERLALLGGHQLREVLLVRHHQVEPAAHDGRALLRGLAAPRRKRARGRVDRGAGFRAPEPRHGAEDLAGRRVVDVDHAARAGVHPGAVDVAGFTEQPGIGSARRGDVVGRVMIEF